jgi:hypothetical protein
MSEDRVDSLVNRLHVTCLTLIRLKQEALDVQAPVSWGTWEDIYSTAAG